jgi:hypothetical protein
MTDNKLERSDENKSGKSAQSPQSPNHPNAPEDLAQVFGAPLGGLPGRAHHRLGLEPGRQLARRGGRGQRGEPAVERDRLVGRGDDAREVSRARARLGALDRALERGLERGLRGLGDDRRRLGVLEAELGLRGAQRAQRGGVGAQRPGRGDGRLEERARVVAPRDGHLRVGQAEDARPRQQEGRLAVAEDEAGDVDKLLEGAARADVLGARARLEAPAQRAAADLEVRGRGGDVVEAERGLEGADQRRLVAAQRRVAAGDGRLDKDAVERARLLGARLGKRRAVFGFQRGDGLARERRGVAERDQEVGQLDGKGGAAARGELERRPGAGGGARGGGGGARGGAERLCGGWRGGWRGQAS